MSNVISISDRFKQPQKLKGESQKPLINKDMLIKLIDKQNISDIIQQLTAECELFKFDWDKEENVFLGSVYKDGWVIAVMMGGNDFNKVVYSLCDSLLNDKWEYTGVKWS